MFAMSVSLAVKRVAVASVAVACFCTAVAAQSPPLGDVARKEQERRKAQPEAGKVYTNKDLPKSAQKPAETAAPAPAAAPEPSSAIPAEGQPAAGEKPAADAAKAPPTGEAFWKQRMANARDELRRKEMFAQALQTRVNSLTSDELRRSDPVQKSRLAGERKDAVAELAKVKQEIEAGKKQITDIEEEARKAGVPPGWLR